MLTECETNWRRGEEGNSRRINLEMKKGIEADNSVSSEQKILAEVERPMIRRHTRGKKKSELSKLEQEQPGFCGSGG